MKVAFVTPRYGPDVVGGAEAAARSLAEHLVSELGHEVEIFTTCATDYVTWADELLPGSTLINGVRVHRFSSDQLRAPGDPALHQHVLSAPRGVAYSDAMRWIKDCGPACTKLIDGVTKSDADVVAFYPYLYYPTVHAIAAVRQPAILHPAAHNEPFLSLPPFRDVFLAADAICYHTGAERQLVERTIPVGATPQIMLGLGVDEPTTGHHRGGSLLGIGDRPYCVALGRVDINKGSTMLAEYFLEYKQRHPGPLALAVVGPVAAEMPIDPDIIVTGAVSDEDKWDILGDAEVLISPSTMESFSLVILESWVKNVPVLVNAACAATVEHCVRSDGGLWFDSYLTFDATLHRLLDDEALRRRLGENGSLYVRSHFSWPVLIRRYEQFLNEAIARGRTSPSVPDAFRAPEYA